MKKITLICFGKLKFPGFNASCAEYEKRLQRYTTFKVYELKPNQIPEKEASAALELLDSTAFKREMKNPILWAMDEDGKSMKTTDWAQNFKSIQAKNSGELIVLIGGSFGLGQEVIDRADKKISLGPQTLSHELARVVLSEQLYRTLSLLAGHPYHNEG